MRLDVYQEETAQIARYQSEILAEVRKKMTAGEVLSRLEQHTMKFREKFEAHAPD